MWCDMQGMAAVYGLRAHLVHCDEHGDTAIHEVCQPLALYGGATRWEPTLNCTYITTQNVNTSPHEANITIEIQAQYICIYTLLLSFACWV